jgi:conserved domain protein
LFIGGEFIYMKKKKELAELAGVSTYTINKLNKNENVTVEVLGKNCKVLDCSLDDIMEFDGKEWRGYGN